MAVSIVIVLHPFGTHTGGDAGDAGAFLAFAMALRLLLGLAGAFLGLKADRPVNRREGLIPVFIHTRPRLDRVRASRLQRRPETLAPGDYGLEEGRAGGRELRPF